MKIVKILFSDKSKTFYLDGFYIIYDYENSPKTRHGP